MGDELSHGPAQNGVNLDIEVKFDLEGQGQSLPKTIGILTKVFYIHGPNLVILAERGDELSREQARDWRTDRHTHTDRRSIINTDVACVEEYKIDIYLLRVYTIDIFSMATTTRHYVNITIIASKDPKDQHLIAKSLTIIMIKYYACVIIVHANNLSSNWRDVWDTWLSGLWSPSKYNNFHPWKWMWNVTYKMAAIWSQPQCVKLFCSKL